MHSDSVALTSRLTV